MCKIKALFFDLDGTLLTSSKTLSPGVVAALKVCRERGIRLFVATGRSPRLDMTLGWPQETLSLFDGGVFSNGACVMLDGQANWARITPAAVAECVRLASRHHARISLHLDNGDHAFNFTLPRQVWGPWGVNESNVVPLDESACARTVKLLFFHEHLVDSVTQLPAALLSDLQAAVGDRVSLYLTDGGCTIQAAAAQVSKLTGVETVRTALGLAEDQIAVFGDDLNDLPMLTRYPVSVAMGNAVPEAKAAARYVTRSCDEDGVAHALYEILHLI